MPRHATSDDENNAASDQSDVEGEEEVAVKNPQRVLQHMFLQIFLSRRQMTDVMAKKVYSKCAKIAKVPQPDPMSSFIGDLDTPLSACGLSLKNSFDTETQQVTWTLINDYSDEPSKLATEYSPQEIAFFRIIVKKIMTSNRMAYAIKQKDAMSYSKRAGLASQLAGQAIINSFVAKGWLNVSEKSRLTLSHRSLTELWKYLRETYDDDEAEPHDRAYVACQGCSDLVTIGWACENEECAVRLHAHCTSAYLGPHQGLCPGDAKTTGDCGQQWKGDYRAWSGLIVGLGDSDEQFALASDADEDEMDEAEEESMAGTQKKKGGRKSTASQKKGKKGKRAADSDEEEEAMDEDGDEEEAEESDDQG
ncbi:non-structural maintenance of chromosomes element 1, partial [Phenoliferia sp. Uapishka_3]